MDPLVRTTLEVLRRKWPRSQVQIAESVDSGVAARGPEGLRILAAELACVCTELGAVVLPGKTVRDVDHAIEVVGRCVDDAALYATHAPGIACLFVVEAAVLVLQGLVAAPAGRRYPAVGRVVEFGLSYVPVGHLESALCETLADLHRMRELVRFARVLKTALRNVAWVIDNYDALRAQSDRPLMLQIAS